MGLKIGGADDNMVSFLYLNSSWAVVLPDFEDSKFIRSFSSTSGLQPSSMFCSILHDWIPLIFRPFIPCYRAVERLTARRDIFHLRRTAASWVFQPKAQFRTVGLQSSSLSLHPMSLKIGGKEDNMVFFFYLNSSRPVGLPNFEESELLALFQAFWVCHHLRRLLNTPWSDSSDVWPVHSLLKGL